MSKKKRITLLAMLIALIAIGSVSAILLVPRNHPSVLPTTQRLIASTPDIIPVLSNVELNASEGFNSSQLVEGPNISPLFVLPPGGNGTIPFTVYSPATIPFDAYVSIGFVGNTTANGVQCSFSQTNFTVNPGQQTKVVLTINVDKDAPSEFYEPGIDVQTNESGAPYYIQGIGTALPWLLIANSTPSCMYIVTEFDVTPISIPPPVNFPSAPAPTNVSITYPIATPTYPQVPNPFPEPTINLTPGESTTVIFACATQDTLSLNTTVHTGFSAEFSPNPLDIIFSWTSGNFYALTVTASPNLSPGYYRVNVEATLGPYPFEVPLQIAIK